MHKNALLLHGAAHGELFDGVVWRDDVYKDLEAAEWTMQELVEAAHEICEKHVGPDGHKTDAAMTMLKTFLKNYELTGLVDRPHGTG